MVQCGLSSLSYNAQGGETPTTLDPYKRQAENLKHSKRNKIHDKRMWWEPMTSPILWMGGWQLLPLGYSIPVGPFEVKKGGLDILYSIPNLKLLSWPPCMEA